MNAATRWLRYDAEDLAHLGAPKGAATALTERGLPENAYQMFVRNTARELDVAELPAADAPPSSARTRTASGTPIGSTSTTDRSGSPAANKASPPKAPAASTPPLPHSNRSWTCGVPSSALESWKTTITTTTS